MIISERKLIIKDMDDQYILDIGAKILTIEMRRGIMEDVFTFTLHCSDTPEFLALVETVEQIIGKKSENILNHINEIITKRFQKES